MVSRYGTIKGMMHFYANDRAVLVETTDGEIARLTIKLRHERLSRAEFFRAIIRGYLEQDPLIEEFMLAHRKTKKNKSNRLEDIMIKEKEEEEKISRLFALDQDDIEDIYDFLEEESDL